MSSQKKKVHFCPQVQVYQPVLMGQAYLLKKQVLNDEQTNQRPSFFQQRRIKLRQLLHQRHLARKKRRAERARLHERLLQESSSKK